MPVTVEGPLSTDRVREEAGDLIGREATVPVTSSFPKGRGEITDF